MEYKVRHHKCSSIDAKFLQIVYSNIQVLTLAKVSMMIPSLAS